MTYYPGRHENDHNNNDNDNNSQQSLCHLTPAHPCPAPVCREFPRLSLSIQVVVDKLIALAQSLLDEQGISWQEILYVGVACPGQVDRCVCERVVSTAVSIL